MRTLGTLLVLSLVGASGCSWSTFDNLSDTVWVDSIGAPKGADTSKFGASLAVGGVRQTGMHIGVLGRANADASRLTYDPNGVAAQQDFPDILGTLQFIGFQSLHPAFAGDPKTGMVAFTLVTNDGVNPTLANTKIAYYDASSTGDFKVTSFEAPGMLKGPKLAEGLVYGEIGGDPTVPDLLMARDDQVMAVIDYTLPEGTLPNGNPSTFAFKACRHEEPTSFSIAEADVDASNAGPELLLATGPTAGNTGPSKIKIFSPAAVLAYADNKGNQPIANCFNTTPAFPVLHEIDKSSDNVVDLGKKMLVADFGGGPAIIASAPAENKLYVFAGDDGTMETDIPAPPGAASFGETLATGDLDGDGVPEIIVGDPKATEAGVANAGAVFIYKYTGNPGNNAFALKQTLYDSQPDVEEHFGQSVLVAPFGTGTQNVLVVGNDGEVFTYFRLNDLYADVRTGH